MPACGVSSRAAATMINQATSCRRRKEKANSNSLHEKLFICATYTLCMYLYNVVS